MDRVRGKLVTLLFFLGFSSPGEASDVYLYRYDALGRLTQACAARPADGEWARYALDHAGNRLNYVNSTTNIAFAANSGISSSSGRFVLIMQGDGNLVLYDTISGYVPLWASNTNGSNNAFGGFQSDGNLVVYAANNTPLWNSSTNSPCAHLAIGDDGNMTITSIDGIVIWSTGTGGH